MLANDNAKLAIEKQAEVVRCLTELSHVLSRGMHLPGGTPREGQPHAAPPITE